MKIAIVKLSALGDIIHSAFVVQFIKEHIPEAKIDWIVEEGFASILEHNSDIDNIKKVNLKSIKGSFSNIFGEIKKLRVYAKENYDIVIDMQGLIKSSIASKILSSHVAGYDKNSTREGVASLFYSDKFDIPYHFNTIDRYRLLVSKALNIDISKDDILKKKAYLFFAKDDDIRAKEFLSKSQKNIIFIVGSTWQSRIYPKEKLVNIADRLDANILIPYGNESEKADGDYIASKSDNVTLLPRMNLNVLKALISNVDLLIGNDTGPSYIAWANNIPSITLFGPTPPTRIYETDINKVLKSSSKIDHYKLDKNDFSISEIKEDQIVEIANSLLDKNIEV
jgi:heptosyltransferase-1